MKRKILLLIFLLTAYANAEAQFDLIFGAIKKGASALSKAANRTSSAARMMRKFQKPLVDVSMIARQLKLLKTYNEQMLKYRSQITKNLAYIDKKDNYLFKETVNNKLDFLALTMQNNASLLEGVANNLSELTEDVSESVGMLASIGDLFSDNNKDVLQEAMDRMDKKKNDTEVKILTVQDLMYKDLKEIMDINSKVLERLQRQEDLKKEEEGRAIVMKVYEASNKEKKKLLNPKTKYRNRDLEILYKKNLSPNYKPKAIRLTK